MTTIIEALDDEHLFAALFAEPSWRPWRAFLATLFGLAMDDSGQQLARHYTGRGDALAHGPYREAWLVCGRRSGKSRILALIAVYLACFLKWNDKLSIGEVGVIMILAADRDQAQVMLGYIKGLLVGNPMLARLISNEGAEFVQLGSRKVSIEVHTNNYRSPRGRTVIAALCDEVAFWRSETSVNPGEETVRALRPSLATLAPHSLLIGASSPYSRSGLLWNVYRRHFGRPDSRVLVWQASSREMNPSLSAELVADALEDDPEGAAAEYLAEFRRDIERFVSIEALGACTIPGRFELPRVAGVRYFGFIDPSGGSKDSFTLAVAHREGDRAVLDCIREVKPPFSPENVCQDFADLLRSYGINRVVSDKYGGVWVAEAMALRGIIVEQSAKAKSELYLELLPAVNSGKVELLDHARLLEQLGGLERRSSSSGRDSINHAPEAHDDLANSAAGVIGMVLARVVLPLRREDFLVGAPSVAATMLLHHDPDWQSHWRN